VVALTAPLDPIGMDEDHMGAGTGTTGPEPVPHPDDVLIDYETGNIRIDGPVEEEQSPGK